MKIGILTQPLIRNYGGILQAYALQLVLKRMGNEVLMLDMHYKKNWFLESFKSTIKVILNSFGLKLNQKQFIINPNLKEFNEIYKNNVLFINKNINKTKRINHIKNYSEIAEYGFEAIIVGSDQIWRPEFSPNMPNYFLDFLKDIKGVKRISYAASFGVDYWKFNEAETKIYSKLVQDFDSVSVREDSAIELCKKNMNVNATLVLDPTLLLSVDDYEKLIDKEECSVHNNTLFCYVLDDEPEKKAIIDFLSTDLNLVPNLIDMKIKYKNINKIDLKKSTYPSIGNWISGFKNAEYIVTDSFHGMVFSIIYNKPFIVIGNVDRGISRFISLLKLLKLESRLIYSLKELTLDKINEPIDYFSVNEILIREKNKSFAFLEAAIGK